MDEAKIKISVEDNIDEAAKSLRELVAIQQEMLGSVNKIAEAQKKENAEIRVQTGLVEKLESKLRDLKVLRNQAEDLKGVKEYNEQIKQTEAELSKLTGTTEKWGLSLKDISGLVLGVFAFDKVLEYGKSMFNTVVETERLQTALKAATSSNEEYAQSITFLNKLSDDYGQNVNVLTGSYKNFIANTKTSTLGLEEKQRIYASIVKTGSALQLSNEQLERSFYAVSQMFGKNKISAEELSTQLADVFPNSVGIMAKAVGVGTAELFKMMEQGQLLADDVLPKFAKELENAYGSKASANLQTVGGQWNRLTNSVIEFSAKANEATGFTKTLASGIAFVADNFGGLARLLGSAIAAFGVYQAVVNLTIIRKTALVAATSAGNFIMGQANLLRIALAGTTDGLSAAQLRGAAAARTFNASLALGPTIAITAALYALSEIYSSVKKNVEDANAVNLNYIKQNDESIKSEQKKAAEFAIAIQQIKTLKEGTEARTHAVQQAINKFPEYLKGINAEISSNSFLEGVYKNVNAQMLKRIDLMAREKQVGAITDQMTTIKADLLSKGVSANTVSEYMKEIGTGTTSAWMTQVVQLEKLTEQLTKAQKGYSEVSNKAAQEEITNLTRKYGMYEISKSQLMQMTNEVNKKYGLDREAFKKEEIEAQAKLDGGAKQIGLIQQLKDKVKELEKLRDSSNDPAKIQKYNAEIANQEKQIKQLTDTSGRATKEIEKAYETREKLLDRHGSYILAQEEEIGRKLTTKELSRFTDRLKAMGKYADDILRMEKLSGEELSIEQIKAYVKQKTEFEKHQAETLKSFDKHQRAYLAAVMKGNREEEKEAKALYEAQKKAVATQYQYVINSNYLKLVANAKSLKDLEDAEKEHNRDMLKEQQRAADVRIREINIEILKLKDIESRQGLDTKALRTELYKELETIQKTYNEVTLKLRSDDIKDNIKQEEDRKEDLLKLTEERNELIKDLESQGYNAQKVAKRELLKDINSLNLAEIKELRRIIEEKNRITKEGFAILHAITDAALTIYGSMWSDRMSKANSETEKALLENEKMWVEWGTQALSVVDSFIQGGVVNGVVSAIAWAAKGVANLITANKRKAQAEFDDLVQYYKDNLYLFEDFMKGIGSNIESVFGEFLFELKLPVDEAGIKAWSEMLKTLGAGADLTISQMVEIGKKIEDNYKTSVSLEKSYHDQVLNNINEQFNKRIESINKEYDVRAERELQSYNAQTLAIQENLTVQLALLLHNEESKTSIMAEFNAKRSSIILATAIADMEIIEGMDQATIDAINAARELRAKKLYDLQNELNQELEWTVNNEEQKRKEYTATEELRRQAQAELAQAELEYSVAQIERNKDKNLAIIEAENEKNIAIELEELRHNDELLRLTQERDAAMQASFEVLRQAVVDGYDQMIRMAKEALDKGAVTIEEYTRLLNLLSSIKTSMGEIDATPPRNIPYWDFDIPNIGHFATGTEYVQLGSNPKGVDTVPAMLTEGESVFKVSHNQRLRKLGISNEEVVRRAEGWDNFMKESLRVTDIPVLKISPHVAQTLQEQKAMETLMNMNMQPVIDELRETREALSKIPINNFNLDENGLHKWVKKGNATTKYNKKRFGS